MYIYIFFFIDINCTLLSFVWWIRSIFLLQGAKHIIASIESVIKYTEGKQNTNNKISNKINFDTTKILVTYTVKYNYIFCIYQIYVTYEYVLSVPDKPCEERN